MQRGYVRLWRKIRDKAILEDSTLCQVFLKALLDAEFKRTQRKVGTKFVDLEPGEFVFGRTAWARALNVPENQIRTRIKLLERMGTISANKFASTYTVYKFNNWSTYATNGDTAHPQQSREFTGKPSVSRPQVTTYEKEKKLRNKEKEDTHVSSCSKPPDGSEPKIIITLPLNDGTEFAITEEFAQELGQLYPVQNLMQSFKAMRGWLIGNPAKRKTNRGIKRFITGWIDRELNGATRNGGRKETSMPRHTQNNQAVIHKLLKED